MDLVQLKYFQMVARIGSLSRAAQELFVTQPNLSKSIARLERELGVPLFDHRRGKIRLNEYGKVFLTSVNRCFSELDAGVHTVKRLYDAGQNVLALGCSIDDFLTDVLKEFTLLHPEIGIRQFCCEPKELARRMHECTIDFAVTPQPFADELLAYEELGRKEFMILTWGNHPLARRDCVAIGELAGERFICDRSRMSADTLKQICAGYGFEPDIAFEVENTELICRLVEGKAGIAFMPMAGQLMKLPQDQPDGAGLRFLHIQDNLPPARLGLVYRKDTPFSAAANCLRDFLISWMEREDQLLRQFGYMK